MGDIIPMKTILVTGIGGLTPRSITGIIRENHPDYRIIGCDIEKKAVGFFMKGLLDEYYVHFEITRKPFWMIMRLLGGFAVYFVLNTLLKLPFSEDFLESGTYSALMVRCARYMIIAFVDFGVYPLLFRKEKRTE